MDWFVIAIVLFMMAFIIGTIAYLDYEDEKYWKNEAKEGRVRIIYIRKL